MNKFLEVVTGKSTLWPAGRSNILPTGNTLLSSSNFGLPFLSSLSTINTPYWIDLQFLKSYYREYCENPVLSAVIDIKAREYRNKRYVVKNRDTDEIEPKNTRKTIPAKIYKLLDRPNLLQEGPEFIEQKKIFRELFGNTMLYGNSGLEVNINNLFSLWNVWPHYMKVKLAGKYFDAMKIGDIIKGWRFEYSNTFFKDFEPTQILHQNAPNLDPLNDLILGMPTAHSLSRPLSNIKGAYETRNVIMRNRGMDLVFTSEFGDDAGKVQLTKEQKIVLQEEMQGYGTLEGQKQFFFSSLPLKVTSVNRDVRRLGLFEEIATDAMLVCNKFGVPEILLKLYLQGATFQNQEASVRRLYQGTLIPESEEEDRGLNDFLKLSDTDWVVEGSFAHVEALQKSKKDEAVANKTISEYMLILFKGNGVTMNQWLKAVGLDGIGPDGDKYMFEMDPERVSAIQSEGKRQESDNSSQNGQEEDEEKEKRIVRRVLELMQ